ncbi:MAG TPA: VOC family protein [Thermoanaerobaculia bacterium]|nr:VOC family protein [Thermoanaerobaculia bacterium]
MTQIDPYLIFDGNCAEAMKFYAKTLGGKLDIQTFSQSPPEMPTSPGDADRVMHARLEMGDRALMASDSGGEMKYEKMQGFFVSLLFPDVAESKRIFETLTRGGTIIMPLEKTFWAESFGMLVDRFGTPWMVSGGHEAKS